MEPATDWHKLILLTSVHKLKPLLYLCMSQASTNWEGCIRKGIWHKKWRDWWRWIADWSGWSGAHPDCWCVCLLLYSLAPWSPEEAFFWHWLTRMFPETGKTVVVVVDKLNALWVIGHLWYCCNNYHFRAAVWDYLWWRAPPVKNWQLRTRTSC